MCFAAEQSGGSLVLFRVPRELRDVGGELAAVVALAVVVDAADLFDSATKFQNRLFTFLDFLNVLFHKDISSLKVSLVHLVTPVTCLQNGPNSGITNWFLKAFDSSAMLSRTTL